MRGCTWYAAAATCSCWRVRGRSRHSWRRSWRGPAGPAGVTLGVLGELDEVAVRIPEVDARHLAQRAGAGHRPLLDRHAFPGQVRHHVPDRRAGHEAQIGTARGGPGRTRAELPP